jgi:hypothetical protein
MDCDSSTLELNTSSEDENEVFSSEVEDMMLESAWRE